jgi:hypothetical protein
MKDTWPLAAIGVIVCVLMLFTAAIMSGWF